ncbi:hypothetical protein CSW21_14230 [Thermus scotoductus]|uniref:Branched-chain amino acid ATP-binding cassette transporter C-terminal domain-containing protein n=1 Tax=Thermus scotoductus TaxID=37636 RepID=A0A430RFI8_THESC|nr:hypothetical protein CSW49_00605 [Thermus scotoductus]RTH06514.1 hypothetical protein CSW45_01685 [Thermus scotoductus]RTH23491.1 hypothetical protein CSW42_01090 [Thermus scotoductus]RTI03171.1 hypothetical protein CSW28_00590 [Thermus scotoductus]RTI17212.1 hypothetical protein CSW21_14230 [Thermus scotoductus]
MGFPLGLGLGPGSFPPFFWLCSWAEVLLLDEPAAGLRAQEKRELASLLRSLAREGYTVLIVDHDMDLIMGLADRVVVMNYGEKIAEGTPKEVQRNTLVRAAYLGEEEVA